MIEKKILILAPHPVSYHAGLYRALHSSELNVEIAYLDMVGIERVYDPAFQAYREGDPSLLDGYVHHSLKNYASPSRRGFFSRVNWELPSVVRNYDVIVIHGFGLFSYWLAFFAALLMRKSIIIKGEGTVHLYDGMPRAKALLRRTLLSSALRTSDAVLFSCSGNREYWAFHGVPESKLFEFRCSVDNAWFRARYHKLTGTRDAIRASFGFKQDDYVVVFASRFTARKRPMDLIAAAGALEETAKEKIALLFVGDGELRPAMETRCRELGLRAAFTGVLEQEAICRGYAAADLYAMLSGYDPSPKVLNEAMNFGLPVLVSRVTGTAADLVREGSNGFTLELGDSEDITQRLSYMAAHREESVRMGQASLHIIEQWHYGVTMRGLELAMTELEKTEL
jgi:glycosyltransferase involved in cell wall biosynthesis